MLNRHLLVTGPIRSGTGMINGAVSRTIFGRDPLPEITPLSDVLALVHRWRHEIGADVSAAWPCDPDLGVRLIRDTAETYLGAVDAAGNGVVAKCPMIVLFPDEVDVLVGSGIRVLLCVRDPMDVLASAYEVQGRQGFGHTREFYDNLVWRSFAGLETLLASVADRPKAVASVRYEAFVAEPAVELARIARWLGREPVDGVREPHFRAPDSPGNPYRTPLLGGPPVTTHVGAHEARLQRDDHARLTKAFGGVRSRLGYGN